MSPSVARRLASTSHAQRLVRLRLEIAERQLLELVLDLAHPEAVGDRRVDVARLLGDLHAARRPEDGSSVRMLCRRSASFTRMTRMSSTIASSILRKFSACRSSLDEKRDGADLGDALDDVGDVGAEELLDALDRRQRVFDDVVEEAGRDGHGVELHVGQEVGDGERVDEVWFAGVADLSPVLEGREDVGLPQQLDVGVRAVGPDLFEQILEANHENRCLNPIIRVP